LVCLSVRLTVSVAQYQRLKRLSDFHEIPSKVLYEALSTMLEFHEIGSVAVALCLSQKLISTLTFLTAVCQSLCRRSPSNAADQYEFRGKFSFR